VGTDEAAAAAVPSVPAAGFSTVARAQEWRASTGAAWEAPDGAEQAFRLSAIAPEQPVRLARVPGPLAGPGGLPGAPAGSGLTATAEESPAGSTWTATDLFQRAAQLVMRSAVPGGLVIAPTEPAPMRTLPRLADPTGSLAMAPVSVPPSAPVAEPRRDLRLLTGSGFAPYAGKGLRAGGMITDLVSRALREADPAQHFTVTFIDDWSAHLGVLLPQGAFDVAFPYYMPDCSRLDRLTAEMRTRCTDFDFSSAFFAVQIGAFVRSGDALATADGPDALFGKTLCRPAGEATFDLEQSALTEPYVRLVRPDTALACLVMLVRGQVDLVTMARQEAEDEIMRRRLADAVSEAGGLATTQTLHAVAAKSNPDGRDFLDLINRGLSALMASGEWFEVVASHQRAQLALAQ
jgi:polar amino acid transport system substrate-binding protein